MKFGFKLKIKSIPCNKCRTFETHNKRQSYFPDLRTGEASAVCLCLIYGTGVLCVRKGYSAVPADPPVPDPVCAIERAVLDSICSKDSTCSKKFPSVYQILRISPSGIAYSLRKASRSAELLTSIISWKEPVDLSRKPATCSPVQILQRRTGSCLSLS